MMSYLFMIELNCNIIRIRYAISKLFINIIAEKTKCC